MNKKMAAALFALLMVPTFAWGGYVSDELHDQLSTAIEAGDFEQFMALREEAGLPIRGMIARLNAENFGVFSQLHNAVQAGDGELANELHTQLGAGMGEMRHGQGRGQGQRGCWAQ